MNYYNEVSGSQIPSAADSGLQSLLIIASLHGIAAAAAELRHEFGHEAFKASSTLRTSPPGTTSRRDCGAIGEPYECMW